MLVALPSCSVVMGGIIYQNQYIFLRRVYLYSFFFRSKIRYYFIEVVQIQYICSEIQQFSLLSLLELIIQCCNNSDNLRLLILSPFVVWRYSVGFVETFLFNCSFQKVGITFKDANFISSFHKILIKYTKNKLNTQKNLY